MKNINNCISFLIGKNFLSRVLLLAGFIPVLSCNDFLEIEPPKAQLVSESVFDDDITARSAMAGFYYNLGAGGFAGGSSNSVTYVASLLADNAQYIGTATNHIQIHTNSILASNPNVSSLWDNTYATIYYANLLIEKLELAADVSEGLRNQLVGEALFIRAFSYFYLVNLFGDIPFTTSTDYRVNASLPRLQASSVYENILADLTKSLQLLPEVYTTGERVRPVKGAARAMLARVHLYLQNWDEAESFATDVIDNDQLYALQDPGDAFLKNNLEAIWQLIPSRSNGAIYTHEGDIFIVRGTPSGPVVREEWVESQWEAGDLRRENWLSQAEGNFGQVWYSYKYKEYAANTTGSEYSMVIRLAEMYLVRAEARAHKSNPAGAKQDLNVIRTRAGLANTAANTPDDLLAAISEERRREFFFEWGHRWFDLLRTGKAAEVLAALKPGWSDSDMLLPIPEAELLVNRNMSQNLGY